jgi:hypothetical protein
VLAREESFMKVGRSGFLFMPHPRPPRLQEASRVRAAIRAIALFLRIAVGRCRAEGSPCC